MLIRDYVWLENTPVAQIDSGKVFSYLHVDHLGTPRLATNDAQTMVWRWDSDAFGSTLADEDPDGDSNATTVNLRFPGQYFDVETGFHYNYFRTYDPSTGRYLESDPIGLLGGLNTFSYVGGNPLKFVDPLGLQQYPGLRNTYFYGQFRAMQQYIQYWLVTAGIVSGAATAVAVTPIAVEAAICYAPEAVVTFSPILTNPNVQQGGKNRDTHQFNRIQDCQESGHPSFQ